MKKIFKKVVSAMTALTMCCTFTLNLSKQFILNAAEETDAGIIEPSKNPAVGDRFDIEDLTYYVVGDNEVEVDDCNDAAGEINIPKYVSYLGYSFMVTSIGDWAFSDCSSLKSITIPDSVTSIGYSAFSYCTSLTSITIPDSVTSIGGGVFSDCKSLASITIGDGVTSIGDYAFYECTSLSSITIPDSVTSIGDEAFYDCESLASITIPDSVTSIGDSAFSGCSFLTSITIPDSVTSIRDCAFYGCTSLTSIEVSSGNEYYISIDGVLFNKDKTELIQYPVGNSRTEYTIPYDVTSIGYSAFYYCSSLTSITIPDSVTSIEINEFTGCTSLASITIPDSVTSIGDDAFYDCTSLTSITIYNPDCEIYDSEDTIYSGSVIRGYKDSTAQEYAEKYGRTFLALENKETNKGDANGDGETTVADIVLIQQALTGKTIDEALAASVLDMNNDGIFNVFDLVIIKRLVLNAG